MTQEQNRQNAEDEIFALRKKMEAYAMAGDTDAITRTQLLISHLQVTSHAMSGIERKTNARGDNSGS